MEHANSEHVLLCFFCSGLLGAPQACALVFPRHGWHHFGSHHRPLSQAIILDQTRGWLRLSRVRVWSSKLFHIHRLTLPPQHFPLPSYFEPVSHSPGLLQPSPLLQSKGIFFCWGFVYMYGLPLTASLTTSRLGRDRFDGWSAKWIRNVLDHFIQSPGGHQRPAVTHIGTSAVCYL